MTRLRRYFLAQPVLGVGCSAALALILAGCGTSKATNAPDSASLARAHADSLAAAELAHAQALMVEAEAAIVTLLKNPASATFQEFSVVQPAEANGRRPDLAACGKILGKPGIGGRSTATGFIYQSRLSVFVDDSATHTQFTDLWGKLCSGAGSRVIPVQ